MTQQDLLLLLLQLLSALARLLLLIPAMFWLLRKLDTRSGINFKQWWDGANERSKTIYLAVRLAVVGLMLVCTLA